MRIIFFGSDDFAAVHLDQLIKAGHEVSACVCGPDKPQGRGMKLAVSPIKKMAQEKSITCLQPPTLKDKNTVQELNSFKADLFVVVAYGRLLTQEILDLPRLLCLNVHGSLLPRYRGAAPINWAILNGEQETGVTLQKVALALDAGDIVAQKTMAIGPDEDSAQLRRRMAGVGAQLLADILRQFPTGDFPLTPQDEGRVSWAPKITKDMGLINWNRPAEEIVNQVRGLQPWPGAQTMYQGKMLKIAKARVSAGGQGPGRPGQIVQVSKDGFYVACRDTAILVLEVQPQAGKLMSSGSFTAGYKIAQGHILPS